MIVVDSDTKAFFLRVSNDTAWPRRIDINEAIDGLLRIQHMYDLDAEKVIISEYLLEIRNLMNQDILYLLAFNWSGFWS